MKCTVCHNETNNPVNYTAYSHAKGGDRVYPVCPKCDRNFNHAAYIVEIEAAKFDKEYYRR